VKAVIPAGGYGTRFLPITKAQPKEMLPVYDKPTIQYVVKEVVDSGIDDILIITGRGKRAIEDHFDKSFELEATLKKNEKTELLEELEAIENMADIHYIRQKEQKGLGDAIYCARKYVGNEPFAVLLGDTITLNKTPCTKQLMDEYEKVKASIIAVERVPREKVSSYGIIRATQEGNLYKILSLVEKPSPEEAPSNLGIIGRYVLTPEIFDCIARVKPGVGGEIQLTDALNLLKDEQDIFGYEFNGRHYDIGSKLDWLKSTIEFALKNPEIKDGLRVYLKERM
jgi:UTP--glucose-1-phosphate uridylyltransferase